MLFRTRLKVFKFIRKNALLSLCSVQITILFFYPKLFEKICIMDLFNKIHFSSLIETFSPHGKFRPSFPKGKFVNYQKANFHSRLWSFSVPYLTEYFATIYNPSFLPSRNYTLHFKGFKPCFIIIK